MGGNGSSHLSREDGGGGGVTFVKGIRLSDKVIHRMKESPSVAPKVSQKRRSPETQTPAPAPPPSADHPIPPLVPPPPVKLVPPPPEPVAAPSPAPEPVAAPSPPPEPVAAPSPPPPPEPVAAPSPLPEPVAALVEEELRQKIKEEMQMSLEEEIHQKRQELQRQLEEMRTRARAEARAAAQAQVEEQVRKTLGAQKAAHAENLKDSIMRERMKTEDERLMVQLYRMELKAHQLEEREKELMKRDALYKEHVAKLEAKCTEFYKVTAESFKKGKEETHSRFARFDVQPLCGDLQSQILKCYKDNAGKTLSCSSIASAYMQCVDNAKKVQLQTVF
uniref:Coiled-coil-helix-coiled-coil-helix domain containing 3b n=1 Tax=Gasterosteus aculeatus TaxID=69293 RepID=G3NKA8_GASAC